MGANRPVEPSSGAAGARDVGEPITVAWFQADIHAYRVPLIRRLTDDPGLSLMVYAHLGGSVSQLEYGEVSISKPPVVDVWSWRLPWGRRPRTILMGGFLRVLRSRVEVVVLPDNVHNLIVWAFWSATFFGGPRIVLFGYGLRPARLGSKWLAPVRHRFRRLLMSRVSAFGAYTEGGRGAMVGGGFVPSKVVTVANTLDTRYLMSIEVQDARNRLTKSVPLRDGVPLLLFVGRMQVMKRLDVLLAAIDILDDEGFPTDLVVVGDGPDRLRMEVRAAAMEGVTMLPAEYDPRRLAALFGAADLLTIPGRVGLTCVHGFAYGVPCITISDTVVEQSPEYEYLIHGENGLIVEGEDPRLYATALREALDDEVKKRRMREMSRATAQRLSMDTMAERFKQVVSIAQAHE